MPAELVMAGHATDGTPPGASAPDNRRWAGEAPIGSAPVVPPDTGRPGGAAFPRGASAASPPLHPDVPPRWPTVVRAELVRRHAELLDAVADVPDDRVLDLSLPPGRAMLADVLGGANLRGGSAGVGPVPADEAGGIDVVISVAGFTRFPDLGAALAATARLLSPTAQLLVVEPDCRPGVTGLAVSSLGALLPPARGVHLARDVPGTVRSVGLTVTDVRRFSLATPVWPLRRFVSLSATRISPRAQSEGERSSEDDRHGNRGTGGAR